MGISASSSQANKEEETSENEDNMFRSNESLDSNWYQSNLRIASDNAEHSNTVTYKKMLNMKLSEPTLPKGMTWNYVMRMHEMEQAKRRENVYDLSKDAYVLLFHNDEFDNSACNRPGSARDMEKIQQVLQHYRCDKLDINENKPEEYVQQKMTEISQKDFTSYSCLIVFIMSHGSVNDTILASDGKWFYFQEDIVDRCTSNRTLDGKPKLFVLQACRGNDRIVADARPPRSDKVDVIIFQSTYQGYVSLRDIEEGSFFMQSFLRLLHEKNQQSIININTLLNREFKEKKIAQVPTMTVTLRRDLIFGELLR
ncbi:caspase-1-like isoform X1 [Anopheles arabiensis]|uniref:caspase-1-like isoform X1 n=1 Tax=Anopheles arabiensis TaxID=7173 RepID=UPI001AAD67E4|nr:caspase-1-like isoform X1 [Anopheles arabiensis]